MVCGIRDESGRETLARSFARLHAYIRGRFQFTPRKGKESRERERAGKAACERDTVDPGRA